MLFKVLYTHQKTKKKKTWQDGYLQMPSNGQKAVLLSDEWKKLDTLLVGKGKITVGAALESDKFLIEVDEQCIISENVSEEAVILKAPSNLPRNIQMVTVKRQGLAAPSKKGKGFKPPLMHMQQLDTNGSHTTQNFKDRHQTVSFTRDPPNHASLSFGKNSSTNNKSVLLPERINSNATFSHLYGKASTEVEIPSNDAQPLLFCDPFSNHDIDCKPIDPCVSKSKGVYDAHSEVSNVAKRDERAFSCKRRTKQSIEESVSSIVAKGPNKAFKRSADQILALFSKQPMSVQKGGGRTGNSVLGPDAECCKDMKLQEVEQDYLDHGKPCKRSMFSSSTGDTSSGMFSGGTFPPIVEDGFGPDDKIMSSEIMILSNRLHNGTSEDRFAPGESPCYLAELTKSSNHDTSDQNRRFPYALQSHLANPLEAIESTHPGSLFPYSGLEYQNLEESDFNSIGAGLLTPDSDFSPVFDPRSTNMVQIAASKKEPLIRGAVTSKIVKRPALESDHIKNEGSQSTEGSFLMRNNVRGNSQFHRDKQASLFASVPNIMLNYQESEETMYSDDDGVIQFFSDESSGDAVEKEVHKRMGLAVQASNKRPDVTKSAFDPIKSFTKPFKPVYSKFSSDCARLESGKSMNTEQLFPSVNDCETKPLPTRNTTIPVEFQNLIEYKKIFKSALIEHLNILLFDLAKNYHSASKKIHINIDSETNFNAEEVSKKGPCCAHGACALRTVKKAGPSKGKLFYCCPENGPKQCKYFSWADDYQKKSCELDSEKRTLQRITLSDSKSVSNFYNGQGVAFYCGCKLLKKGKNSFNDYGDRGRSKWRKSKRYISDGEDSCGRKYLFLALPFKGSSSSYSKDDLWIISKNFKFDPGSTFIAKSSFYGPNSSGDLEISAVSSYSPSNWQSGDTVHAILACNAGTEMSCMDNLDRINGVNDFPILKHLINGEVLHRGTSLSTNNGFTCPLVQSNRNEFCLSENDMVDLLDETVNKYRLNEDQALALRKIASMLVNGSSRDKDDHHITLIHGVFGAGKSFLLAVVILFLVEIFRQNSMLTSSWKILISSTTNVAVDRVLQGLLDLEFEDFVRVGSVKKIAKPVLPYSVHATGTDNQELKELQSMLKSDLSHQERALVRKSIERHRLGLNRKKLQDVPVVGVTCAASVFPCLDNLSFKVHLLDECSQMTEPLSMMPIARFKCEKLILVGDPKQLSPTIQGSEASNKNGLERTLFDRLKQRDLQPVMLRTQYRCHPMISAIPNILFYKGELRDGICEEDRSPMLDWLNPVCFYNVSKGKEKCGADGSFYNQEEAEFVVYLINAMLLYGNDPRNIGVITQYKSQAQKISFLLSEQSVSSTYQELKSIQISTVDAFQGAEKEIIILSCVRTDHVGFIDCDRRTNVALTRAKRHLLIVGNLKILVQNSLWSYIIECCSKNKDGITSSKAFCDKMEPTINEKKLAREIEVSKKRKRKKTAKTCSSDQFNANGHSSTCDSDLIDDAEWRDFENIDFSNEESIEATSRPPKSCFESERETDENNHIDCIIDDDELEVSFDFL